MADSNATYNFTINEDLPDYPAGVVTYENLQYFTSGNNEVLAGQTYESTLDANGEGTQVLPAPDNTGTLAVNWVIGLPSGESVRAALSYSAGAQELSDILANASTTTDPDTITAALANKQNRDTDAVANNLARMNASGDAEDSSIPAAWNATDMTMDITHNANVTGQVNQEFFVLARNNSGSNITNGQVVKLTGSVSSRPTIALAQADAVANARQIGVATEDIDNNVTGFVTVAGLVRGLNTSAYNEGDVLYLSTSVAGAFTATKPTWPSIAIEVGIVVVKNATLGSIFVGAYETGAGAHEKAAAAQAAAEATAAALYQPTSEKSAASGYASLDSNTRVPYAELIQSTALILNSNRTITELQTALGYVSLPRYYADAYDSLSAAFAAAVDGVLILSPDTTYDISTAITFIDKLVIIGGPGSIIRATAAMSYVVGNTASLAGSTQLFHIQNVKLDGNSNATNCLKLLQISRGNSLAVSGLEVTGATGAGILMDRCQGASFQAIRAESNGGYGVDFQSCNASKVFGLVSKSNTSTGVRILNSGGGSGGMMIYGLQAELNGDGGLLVDSVNTQTLINGGWIENNTNDGIVIDDSLAIMIQGCRIAGTGTGTNRAVRLTGTTNGVQIGNNVLSGGSGYATVEDESSGTGNVIGPNRSESTGVIFELSTRSEKLNSEMVTNTDFEVDATGWTTSACTLAQSGAQAHSGSFSGLVTLTGSNGRIYENFTLDEGGLYYVSAWVYLPTGSAPASGARLRIDTGDGTINVNATATTLDAWVEMAGYFVATGTSGQLGIQGVGASTTLFYTDDITLKRVLVTEGVSIATYGGSPQFTTPIQSGLNF